MLAEKVAKMAKNKRVKNDGRFKLYNGLVPFGFKLVDGRYQVDGEEMAVMDLIVEFATEKDNRSWASKAEAELFRRKMKSRHGKILKSDNIKRMLKNFGNYCAKNKFLMDLVKERELSRLNKKIQNKDSAEGKTFAGDSNLRFVTDEGKILSMVKEVDQTFASLVMDYFGYQNVGNKFCKVINLEVLQADEVVAELNSIFNMFKDCLGGGEWSVDVGN